MVPTPQTTRSGGTSLQQDKSSPKTSQTHAESPISSESLAPQSGFRQNFRRNLMSKAADKSPEGVAVGGGSLQDAQPIKIDPFRQPDEYRRPVYMRSFPDLSSELQNRLERYGRSMSDEEVTQTKKELGQALGFSLQETPEGKIANFVLHYHNREDGSHSAISNNTVFGRYTTADGRPLEFSYPLDGGWLTIYDKERPGLQLRTNSPTALTERIDRVLSNETKTGLYQRETLNRNGREWLQTQAEGFSYFQRISLASTFELSTGIQDKLSAFISAERNQNADMKLDKDNDVFIIGDSVSNETFAIRQPVRLEGLPDRLILTGLESSHQVSIVIEADKLTMEDPQSMEESINWPYLRSKISEAMSTAENEQSDVMEVRNSDLTSDKVGCVALADIEDGVINSFLDDAQYFAPMVNSLKTETGADRYNFITKEDASVLVVTPHQTPEQLIDGAIGQMHAEGIRSFCINLYGHGDIQGISFTVSHPTGSSTAILSGEELTALFDRYQDSTFYIRTVACHGGNLADALQEYRDPTGKQGRIRVALQTKKDDVNFVSSVGDPGQHTFETISGGEQANWTQMSAYDLAYYHFLSQYSEGEAHYQADQFAKRIYGTDAEMWISSPLGGYLLAGL